MNDDDDEQRAMSNNAYYRFKFAFTHCSNCTFNDFTNIEMTFGEKVLDFLSFSLP